MQHLRELSLEEGKAYIQAHIEELTDHAAIGNLLADEARLDPKVSPSGTAPMRMIQAVQCHPHRHEKMGEGREEVEVTADAAHIL